MKMVAAAKLKKAQGAAEDARPYAERMERMLSSLAGGITKENAPPLLAGTGSDKVHLLVVVSSDRGLCGGFNGMISRAVKARIKSLDDQGHEVKLMIIGRKGVTLLRREHSGKIVKKYEDLMKPAPAFEHADEVVGEIRRMFDDGEFDVCTVYYNKFLSAIAQEVTPLQLIPFKLPEGGEADEGSEAGGANEAQYEFEPDEEAILNSLLPKNLSVQVYRAMLESFASEQGARMTAMDNATRNAGDMIDSLSITYNRMRQAQITNELIEIISGAEAL
jgi:F-type H+-transporting ATPase subunit gamma